MAHTVVEHLDGMRFSGQGASGHSVLMDAAETSGGQNSGPRPVEVLLASLGGCTGMDVISILRKMKTEPQALRVEIDDERAAEYPKVITHLHLTYVVKGDVPRENVEKAVNLSLEKYCPIVNTLSGVAEISSEIQMVP